MFFPTSCTLYYGNMTLVYEKFDDTRSTTCAEKQRESKIQLHFSSSGALTEFDAHSDIDCSALRISV